MSTRRSALAAVIAARNIHDVSLRVGNVNSATLWFGSQSVPLDGKSNMRLRYRGPRADFPVCVGH